MVHVLDMITLCPADTLPKLAPAQACIDNASNKSEESTSFIRLVSTTFSKACQKLLQGCFLLFLTHTGETATRSRNMCVCVTVTPLPKSVNLSLSHSNISLLSWIWVTIDFNESSWAQRAARSSSTLEGTADSKRLPWSKAQDNLSEKAQKWD